MVLCRGISTTNNNEIGDKWTRSSAFEPLPKYRNKIALPQQQPEWYLPKEFPSQNRIGLFPFCRE